MQKDRDVAAAEMRKTQIREADYGGKSQVLMVLFKVEYVLIHQCAVH